MNSLATSRRFVPYDESMEVKLPTFHDFINSGAVRGALGTALHNFRPSDFKSSDHLDVALTRAGWTITGDQLWAHFIAWRRRRIAVILRFHAEIGVAP